MFPGVQSTSLSYYLPACQPVRVCQSGWPRQPIGCYTVAYNLWIDWKFWGESIFSRPQSFSLAVVPGMTCTGLMHFCSDFCGLKMHQIFRGSALAPAGGAYSAPLRTPRPLADGEGARCSLRKNSIPALGSRGSALRTEASSPLTVRGKIYPPPPHKINLVDATALYSYIRNIIVIFRFCESETSTRMVTWNAEIFFSNAHCTPPTRLNSTVASRQRRRCVLDLTALIATFLWNMLCFYFNLIIIFTSVCPYMANTYSVTCNVKCK